MNCHQSWGLAVVENDWIKTRANFTNRSNFSFLSSSLPMEDFLGHFFPPIWPTADCPGPHSSLLIFLLLPTSIFTGACVKLVAVHCPQSLAFSFHILHMHWHNQLLRSRDKRTLFCYISAIENLFHSVNWDWSWTKNNYRRFGFSDTDGSSDS